MRGWGGAELGVEKAMNPMILDKEVLDFHLITEALRRGC